MHSMNYLGSIFANVKGFYNEINGATLTGAIDVIVVEQPDGSFTCSPFHVRFGKLGVLRSRLKMVDLELNGEPLNIHMKLGESGEAFFVEEVPEDQIECSAHLATSPIPDSGFSLYQENILPPRRNSADFTDKFQNQVSDYTHRRYTDGQGTQKTDFSAQKREYQKRKESTYDYSPPADTAGQDQDAMFVMDDLDDPSQECSYDNKPSATAKTFHAEEVNDKESRAKEAVRKISINNDFKPISLAMEEPNLPPTAESKQNTDETNSQIDDPQKLQNNGNGNKKKKKTKKSGSKKKNSQRKSSASSSNGYSSQSELTGVDPCELEKSIERSVAGEISAIPSYVTNNLNQDIHFFSDTDIVTSKLRDQVCCRDTPVQSDSELEIARGSGVESDSKAGIGQNWRWGQLPSPIPLPIPNAAMKQPAVAGSFSSDDEPTKPQTKDELPVTSATQGQGGSSMLSGMFSFMKPSRGSSQPATTGSEGLYLAELADGGIDPEVAALYFPSHPPGSQTSMPQNITGSMAVDISGSMATEEDYESGNGPSLPQSPSSVEGPLCKGIDSDEDDFKIFSKGFVGLSLCGPSVLDQPTASLVEAFERDAVRFETLCSDPMLVQNPKLVVRLRDKFMPWSTAAPILLSLLVYHRPLPKAVLQSMTSGVHEGKIEDVQIAGNKTVQRSSGLFSWNWRRSAEKQVPGETNVDSAKIATNTSSDANPTPTEQQILSTDTQDKSCITDPSQEAISMDDPNMMKMLDSETNEDEYVAVSTQTSFPSLSGVAGGGYSGSQSSEESDEGASLEKNGVPVHQPSSTKHSTDKFRKTLRLSSEQIESLNLREGMNEMEFSVTTAYQGTSRCKCHVFKWRHDDKIVISDIDGTITKSDVLGHIFPMVGKDWAQSGVAQLFTKIKNNGYKILYLSSRAIGQAKVTREYLRSIKQGELSLPDGPLLLNPTSLLRAFHREVIVKKPEEFKIQCMSDIMALFPTGCKPFYAGYGNRVNDVCAYQTVGIPIVRIFTINYKGELKHELTQTFQSSYSNMSYIVDHLFPPVKGEVCEDFSQFIYWREPVAHLPEILPPITSHTLPSIPEGPADH